MKIITINVNKGGAGKTTFAHNFAEYLKQNYRVLLLDFDDSANLTNRYGYFDKLESTVISLFEQTAAKPIHIDFNLDLIAGHREVELMKERITPKRRREYLLGKWLGQNAQMLEESYDYILIDTENDEGILTQNAIIVSDLVVGIAEASKDSVSALSSLREFVNELNHEFDEDTKLAFVANKINLAESASKELLDILSNSKEYLGYLPRRTILADEQSIFDRKLDSTQVATVKQVSLLFDNVLAQLEEVTHG